MRIIFIALSVILLQLTAYSQQMTDYNKLWKKADELIQKSGLTASALQEVRKIKALAVKEKNHAQQLKALVYEGELINVNEEQATQQTIDTWNIELKNSREPVTALLHSMIATLYWNYFQSNRYRLYDRNRETEDPDSYRGREINTKDIESLSADELHALISKHFLASISKPEQLTATSLKTYDPIIVKGNAPGLRPSLYDLLAHTALAYFTNPERDLRKAAIDFEISDPQAFISASDFISWKPQTSDTGSLYLRAIQIYQHLIRNHLKDQKPEALIDVDLERLEFMHRVSVHPDKDELYTTALKQTINKYPKQTQSGDAAFAVANLLFTEAGRYTGENPDNRLRYLLVEVKQQLEDIIKTYPKSAGAISASNLLKELLRKSIQLQTEKVNLPGQPFRTYIRFTNANLMYYRIIKVDDQFPSNQQDRYNDSYWKTLTAMKFLKTVKQNLPLASDYRPHTVEIRIDGLPVGRYALLAGINEDFSLTNNPMAVQYFYVSAIAWVNQNNHYFFLHRETGQPLEGAAVQLWSSNYDYTTRKQVFSKKELLKANKDGYVLTPVVNRGNTQTRLEVSWKDDRIFPDDDQLRPYPIYREPDGRDIDEEKKLSRAFLFTDRAIYRPGQEVFFKAIYVRKNKNDKRSSVIQQLKTKIYLKDVNDQVIDSVPAESNAFGSVSGKFRLPVRGLTGSFTVVDEYTGESQFIQVEEYKRPKFQVELIQPKTGFRLNDSVVVDGTAIAYAGNPISGSKVTYRVTRTVNFPPMPYYSRLRIFPYSPPVEITNGTVVTGPDGKFRILFPAIPDKKVDPEMLPIFFYNIQTDVTDQNGETRSAETMVPIGYHSLLISASVPAIIYQDSATGIKLSATNLSGEPQKTAFKVTAYELETPDRLIRPRYWNKPDTFLFDKAEYLKYFPYDEYTDESEKESWKRKGKSWELADTTGDKQSTIVIPKGKLKPGVYLIELIAIDKSGKEIKTQTFTELRTKPGDAGKVPEYFQATLNKQEYQPGEKAKLDLQSAANQLHIIHQIQYQTEEEENDQNTSRFVYDLLRLNKESKTVEYPVTENERGGFGLFHVFVKHNRLFIHETVVTVPWTNKELDIRLTSFRDKTLPGSREEWTMQVSGKNGEKLSAEILTSMYDLSLDQFYTNPWNKPQVYPEYIHRYRGNWEINSTYRAVESENRYLSEKMQPVSEKSYSHFIWHNGRFLHGESYDLAGKARGARVEMQTMRSEAPADMALADSAPASTKLAYTKPVVAKDEEVAEDTQQTKNTKTIRSDFRETAFFFPDLKTDAEGNVKFSFIMPEALTEWKWQVLAHTSDLAMGMATKNIITQKELMVQPNLPRFLREGDKITVAAKVVNLTSAELIGQSNLQLIDAETGQVVDGLFTNVFPVQHFTAPANGSVPVEFTITIPYSFNKPLLCRITAKAGGHEDGEEMALPVLTNRMLITETLPLQMIGVGTKTFSFEKLLQSGKSPTLTNHALTVEYSSNPAWYAVQALPYLTQFPYSCAEQEFNRFYANALASMIANTHPKIRNWYEQKLKDSTDGKASAFISNLEKNAELKNILLEETPWVLDSKTEANQQKQIGQLFDLFRIAGDLENSLVKLSQSQTAGGGFVWFPGGPEDRYITQYIITGIGRLNKLGAVAASQQQALNEIAQKGLKYLSQEIRIDHTNAVKNNSQKTSYVPHDLSIQYLYCISFFPEYKPDAKTLSAIQYFRGQAKKTWVNKSRLTQAMIALATFRQKDATTSKAILAALKEQSVNNETLGRYWKDLQPSYYWYQAPVETQALMIEAFEEIANDQSMVSGLKQWLLLQKQTQNWRTTKATADACYALLLRGSDWLAADPDVKISLGTSSPVMANNSKNREAGTGYFKSVVDGRELTPQMGTIKVEVANAPVNEKAQLSWGAVYWQYFENLDNITPAASPLSIKKTWWLQKTSDRGPVLTQVSDNTVLKPGDKLTVRLELRISMW